MHLFSFLFAMLVMTACDNAQSSAITPEASKGTLYLRTYMWTGAYGTSLDISWLYLGNDGVIVRNPKHGVDPLDVAKEKADNAKNTGTWNMEGNKILVSWSDGKQMSWSFEKEKGVVSSIDGGIVTVQSGMPAGYRLEGKYAALSVLPNVSNSQTIVFKNDGTFSMNSTGTVTTSDVSGVASSDKEGKYTITGNTLTLTFGNGEIKKSVITIWDTGNEKNLVINTRYFPQSK